ncbi:MAG TPA: universal stress protein [Vicinamibacterales bacterium]
MHKISRVLAAVDFSAPARAAFEHALAVARRHGAKLFVIHAVSPQESFSRAGRERLELSTSLRRRAREAGVDAHLRVQHGDPVDVILLHADSLRPDVIVIGTHQRSGLARLRAGSISTRIAAKAKVPVLLVPAGAADRPIVPFGHVAVAVDFSDASSRAVEQALAIADETGDRVTLLHVVPGFTSVPPHLHRYGVSEYQQQLTSDARRRLQLAVPARRRSPAGVHTRVLVGDTATAIDRTVKAMGADLLVVGVSDRGALSKALFGTTGARLLETSDVPMLAVPVAPARIAA